MIDKEAVLYIFKEMEKEGFAVFKRETVERTAVAFARRYAQIEDLPLKVIQRKGTGSLTRFTQFKEKV